jgi:hypothetical protein
MTKTINEQNIDKCVGDIFPINAKKQGEVFEEIKPFMNSMRYHQLIKKVNYKIEIEYYPEDLK